MRTRNYNNKKEFVLNWEWKSQRILIWLERWSWRCLGKVFRDGWVRRIEAKRLFKHNTHWDESVRRQKNTMEKLKLLRRSINLKILISLLMDNRLSNCSLWMVIRQVKGNTVRSHLSRMINTLSRLMISSMISCHWLEKW